MTVLFARLLLASLLAFAPPAQSQGNGQQLPPQRIAAVVNDDVVSMRDLEERLQLALVTSGAPNAPEARQRLAPQVLRGLIEETLQLQEAERLGITVSREELDQALTTIARRNEMSVEEMRQFLASSGVAPRTLDHQLEAQIAWVKVVNRQIRPQVAVTVDQLELAVEEARENQGQPELLLSEIVLPIDDPSQEQAVAADAQRLVQTLREGAEFGSLAQQVSAAASASVGGDIGWVPANRIPPELLAALDRMQPGDVSAPIRSPLGFHIFALRDRRLSSNRQIDDDHEVRLTQILFPVEQGDDGPFIERLRAQAAALRPDLENCQEMIETADRLAAPASGELGWLRLADLPQELAQPLLALPEQQVSQPLRGPAGIHLLMVCERRGAGVSELDREAIAERLENERIERLARRYLRDLRKQAFVEIRL